MLDKRLTSIEFQNTICEPYITDEIIMQKLTISKTGEIRHCIYNGRQEELIEDFKYKINVGKMAEFFDFLVSKIKVQEWSPDYSDLKNNSRSWKCKIRYSDNTIKKVIGTVDPPPNGKKLMNQILKLVDYELKPWLF